MAELSRHEEGMRILEHRRISPQAIRAAGWERHTDGAWPFRYFVHKGGWKISHCGHPTALWPYVLQDPTGRMILTGAAFGNPPYFGTAWPTVASAVEYVATQAREGKC